MTILNITVHPGRILRDEFLEPMGLSAGRLAAHIDVPRTRIERIVNEETGVSVDTARRLAAAFNTTPQFWLNLQTAYDIAVSETPPDIEPLQMVNV